MFGRSRQEPPPKPLADAASAAEPVPKPQLFQQGTFGQVAPFCFWRQPKKPGVREVPPFDARMGLNACVARQTASLGDDQRLAGA
jgi:hypothetical protein